MRCTLDISESYGYHKEAGYEPFPALPIVIHREELRGSVRVKALLDTGFDGALIISRSLGAFIREAVKASDGLEELDAAGIAIPCDVYHINVRVKGKWFRVKALLPQLGDLGTIMGRRIINRLCVCLRGYEERLFLASA